MRLRLLALPLAALTLAAPSLAAQEPPADAPSVPPSEEAGPVIGWEAEPIIVTGVREAQERVAITTEKVTRRPRVDKPISKFYRQACFGVFGMEAGYAAALIDRMQENARRLGIPVGGEGCQVNVLVGFVRDGQEEIRELRRTEPKLFGTLLDYEFDRILRGNGAVQAWHGTTVKSSDGREFATAGSGNDTYAVNQQYGNASRLRDEIRVDMDGAIVLIDADRTPGKTVRQLADYASMRAFVSTDDLSDGGGTGIETILTLFDEDVDSPEGLTRFDKAYLEAVYKLPRTATGNQIENAIWSIYRGKSDEEEIDGG